MTNEYVEAVSGTGVEGLVPTSFVERSNLIKKMIEYYIAMSIFLLLVASIGYFMYRWYEVVQEVNIINSRTIEGVSEDNVNLTALASIHQPCVANLEISQNNPSNPICNSSFGLTCVTGMYLGNGDGTNTGVCLSNIGSYCDTNLYIFPLLSEIEFLKILSVCLAISEHSF